MADYYTRLGLHPKASTEVIGAAYRALVKKYQGDTKKLKLLNEAKEILLDNTRKKSYDEYKPTGKIVGSYKIIKKIAEGGFGTTYYAEHTTLHVPVCIKHALNVSALDEEILLSEAKAIWDLRHWGIPAIRDIIRMPDGSLALVMSYVPGKTLAQVVEEHGKIDPEHIAWITERILNILYYLHLHGVIHGDMKPQNIIIQAESHTITLVDYGLSIVRPKPESKAKGYTPYFAAPEQIEDKTLLPETDLYGLGMSLIFALGGDVEHIKVPGETPPEMVKFLKRLIRRDPLQRPKIWQEENLCETIKDVRQKDFGRTSSGMKPLNV